MITNLTPKDQAELDARIEVANRRQDTWHSDNIMGMLNGRCLGGSVSPLVLRYRYRSEAWMANPMGMTHGGMLASMLDNAMGITAYILSPYAGVAPTAELHISYLKPVPTDAALEIRVTADQVGGRMIRMRAELRLEGSDTLYVTGAGANCPIKPQD